MSNDITGFNTQDYNSSFLPYILRAAYDWLTDNNLGAYIEVDTSKDGIIVPTQYIENNRIIFDLAPQAINNLKLTNSVIEFEARFGSKVNFISIPINAIISLFSPEYAYGISFQPKINISLPIHATPNTPKPTTTTPILKSPVLTKTTSKAGKNPDHSRAQKPKLTLLKKNLVKVKSNPNKNQDD